MNKMIKLIKCTLERCHVHRAVIFGSRARGDFHEQSDYDIAVWGTDNKMRAYILEQIDELPTLQKIDVVFMDDRDKDTKIYQNIIKYGVILVDKFFAKLENYQRDVGILQEVLQKYDECGMEELQDVAIKRFEFTTELAWKTTREYLLSLGEVDINSLKPVMRVA